MGGKFLEFQNVTKVRTPPPKLNRFMESPQTLQNPLQKMPKKKLFHYSIGSVVLEKFSELKVTTKRMTTLAILIEEIKIPGGGYKK